ncbi:peroxiredoxin [Candidatus Woesearchaeota archaeon]|nr:peroxiredoxin [Candidatus Woesearchaeota archaeon]
MNDFPDKTLSLADYQGGYLVLYFYPKDNTPGCTRESQAFAKAYPDFQALGVEVVGVSRDSLKSHDNFKRKLELPFGLIADTEETLCQTFAVIKDKMMYGKPARGVERSTFLLGPGGEIIREWRKVSVDGHAEAVLQTVREVLANPGSLHGG